jgi:hypothetical protein
MTQNLLLAAALVAMTVGAPATAASQSDQPGASHSGHTRQSKQMPMAHEHGAPVPAITYTELQQTADQLTAARKATTKYQDVRAAEADGYRAIGPHVPGMGIHYVRQRSAPEFAIDEPPILLYERDPSAASGLRLVGVSYLVVAPGGADGQPATSPFPKALASWHKHNNVCVLPDSSASVELTEAQCAARGGRFTAETSWMVHAWIWKDSPTGVFSPTNPLVK